AGKSQPAQKDGEDGSGGGGGKAETQTQLAHPGDLIDRGGGPGAERRGGAARDPPLHSDWPNYHTPEPKARPARQVMSNRIYRRSVFLRVRLDRRIDGDGELPVVGVFREGVEADRLDQKHPSAPHEARLGREPDLVVDFPPQQLGTRSFLEPSENSPSERKIVQQEPFHLDELPIFFVDPGPSLEFLQDFSRFRRRLEIRPGLKSHDDRRAAFELFATDDLQVINAKELIDELGLAASRFGLRLQTLQLLGARRLERSPFPLLAVFLLELLWVERFSILLDETPVRLARLSGRVDLVDLRDRLLGPPIRVEALLGVALGECVLVEQVLVAVKPIADFAQESVKIRKRGLLLVESSHARRERQQDAHDPHVPPIPPHRLEEPLPRYDNSESPTRQARSASASHP